MIRLHRSDTPEPPPCDGCPADHHTVEIVAGEFPNLRRLNLCEQCAQIVLDRLEIALRPRRSPEGIHGR